MYSFSNYFHWSQVIFSVLDYLHSDNFQVGFAVFLFSFYLLSHVWLFATRWPVTHQAPLSMGFLRQDYWRQLPSPPSGDLPNLAIISMSLKSPLLAGGFFTTSTTWEAFTHTHTHTHTHTVFYEFSFINYYINIEYSSLCYTVGSCCLFYI